MPRQGTARPPKYWPISRQASAAVTARQFVGTPDDVAADLQTRVLDSGVDGVVVSMPANGHEPGVVALAAGNLGPATPDPAAGPRATVGR